MSNSFSSPSTRGMGRFQREVETRMKHLDIFSDDYKPGSDAFGESNPGMESRYQKGGDTQDAHDDYAPEADPKFKMAASGKVEDQAMLDEIDQIEQAMESRIKGTDDQFPGSQLKKLQDEVGKDIRKRSWENEIKDEDRQHPYQSLTKRVEKLLSNK
jgi:hypothetical protein